MLENWSLNIISIHERKFRHEGRTGLDYPLYMIGEVEKEFELSNLPRMPHLKEKTACEKFPVGWNIYTLPETNFYKLIEIKFDNRFKDFCQYEKDKDWLKTGKFVTEFLKSLLMNLIEWRWDNNDRDLNILHKTYKRNLGMSFSTKNSK